MFSGLGLGGIMGSPTGQSSGLGTLPGYAAGHSSNGGQGLLNMSPYQQQAAAAQQWTSIHARQFEPPARWRVDGKDVSFEEFVQLVFPEDTPERTFFLLKYSK